MQIRHAMIFKVIIRKSDIKSSTKIFDSKSDEIHFYIIYITTRFFTITAKVPTLNIKIVKSQAS